MALYNGQDPQKTTLARWDKRLIDRQHSSSAEHLITAQMSICAVCQFLGP
jgi:hypothetical protein